METTKAHILWLVSKHQTRERIVRFACDCALINIELIKPYTDKYELILGFLRNPTDNEATVAYTASLAAARVASANEATAAYKAARAVTYSVETAVYTACTDYARDAATSARDAAYYAGADDNANNANTVNKLLVELINETATQ